MGRKKFRLIIRKNEERKKYATSTATSLVVFIPKRKLPALNLDSMRSLLSSSGVLPHSVIVQTTPAGSEAEAEKIVLCCLETASETPVIKYSVTITDDFTWVLSVHGNSVTPQTLAGTPRLHT